jgi:hypothetical protein
VQRAGCVRLLPVPYFHVVYTLPSELRDIAYQNKRVGTVKLRRSSRNTGARGLSSCRGGLAVPLRPRRRRSTACSKPTPGPELSAAPRRRARSPRLRAASRPVAIPTGRSSLLTRRWRGTGFEPSVPLSGAPDLGRRQRALSSVGCLSGPVQLPRPHRDSPDWHRMEGYSELIRVKATRHLPVPNLSSMRARGLPVLAPGNDTRLTMSGGVVA